MKLIYENTEKKTIQMILIWLNVNQNLSFNSDNNQQIQAI